MKPELIEGPQATANFERFASLVLQANPNKKKKEPKKRSPKKQRKSDKN